MKKSKQKSILDLKKTTITVLNKKQIELIKGGAVNNCGVTTLGTVQTSTSF